jgi:hypothetical protein
MVIETFPIGVRKLGPGDGLGRVTERQGFGEMFSDKTCEGSQGGKPPLSRGRLAVIPMKIGNGDGSDPLADGTIGMTFESLPLESSEEVSDICCLGPGGVRRATGGNIESKE